MVSVTFENVPTAFNPWARFILPRVTGKCNMRAWAPMCNLSKSSKHFPSWTTRRIGLKSSVCNSPGGSLYASERSTAIWRSVPEISWGTDTHTHTHTVSALIWDTSNYICSSTQVLYQAMVFRMGSKFADLSNVRWSVRFFFVKADLLAIGNAFFWLTYVYLLSFYM